MTIDGEVEGRRIHIPAPFLLVILELSVRPEFLGKPKDVQ